MIRSPCKKRRNVEVQVAHRRRQSSAVAGFVEVRQPDRPQIGEIYRHRDRTYEERRLVDKAVGHPRIKAVMRTITGETLFPRPGQSDGSCYRQGAFLVRDFVDLE